MSANTVSVNRSVVWDLLNDTPEMRRNIFRGKDLGAIYNDAQKSSIAAGTFDGLYLGDYWLINNIKWRIVDFDYYLNTGVINTDRVCTKHHVVIMPDTNLMGGSMEQKLEDGSEAEGAGGYVNSYGRTVVLENARTEIYAAFGKEYILKHSDWLFNNAPGGLARGFAEVESDIEIPSDLQMFGTTAKVEIMRSTDVVLTEPLNVKQFHLFTVAPSYIWPEKKFIQLRDLRNPKWYSCIYNDGLVGSRNNWAYNDFRPYFTLCGEPEEGS